MPIQHAIWKVGQKPTPLAESSLVSEAFLESMIVEDSTILSERWMLIGRQVRTRHGGIIDLLALNADGQLIIIELKKAQTPREIVSQALDYASWAEDLGSDEIAGIYNRFSNGASLDVAFQRRFGLALDEEQLNATHQIVIVAAHLDLSTERIVNYLNSKDFAINVIFFQVFQDGEAQYLSRSWLIDPVETESKAVSTSSGPKTEWNGEYYVSFGNDDCRNWEEAIKYGFISAGGGLWYTKTLFMLSPGDRIWVNVPRYGYVGVGRVTGTAVRASEFEVNVNGENQRLLDVANYDYLRSYADDDEHCEYFVPVEWIETRPLNKAISETGFFGNQNTVCRPRTTKWDHTVERLKSYFTFVSY